MYTYSDISGMLTMLVPLELTPWLLTLDAAFDADEPDRFEQNTDKYVYHIHIFPVSFNSTLVRFLHILLAYLKSVILYIFTLLLSTQKGE